MEIIPVETASIIINLKNLDDTADFDIANHPDLFGDKVKISVFTAASEAFNQDAIEDINISCDLEGDYSINTNNDIVSDNSFPLPIVVPASTFLVIVVRGESSLPPSPGYLTILGAAFISESELSPDSTGNVSIISFIYYYI
jgi:hypothetical protein